MVDHVLKPETSVREYVVKRILGQGSYGITYLARDTDRQRPVAMKEYFPQQFATRGVDGSTVTPSEPGEHDVEDFDSGLKKFLDEAKTLAGFKDDHIVRVFDYFEHNGTAYVVMQYEEGGTLERYLAAHKRPIDEQDLLDIFVPLLNGLRTVHATWFLHRDIKPENIYLREKGDPLLIDFGSARHAASARRSGMTEYLTRGYAPPEQYDRNAPHGPWTDIYAIGATMYQCVTRIVPDEGVARVRGEDPVMPAVDAAPAFYSRELLEIIDWMMKPDYRHRPQSVDEVLGRLQALQRAAPTVDETAADSPAATRRMDDADLDKTRLMTDEPPAQPAPRSGRRLGLAASLLVVVAVALGWGLLEFRGDRDVDRLAQQARELIAAGRLDQAAREIDALATDHPSTASVAALQAELAAAVSTRDKQQRAEIEAAQRRAALAAQEQAAVQQAAARLNECAALADPQRLESDTSDNAATCYRDLLAADAGNSAALAGLRKIEDTYALWVREAAQAREIENARGYYRRLAALNPDYPGLARYEKIVAALAPPLPETPTTAAEPPGAKAPAPQPAAETPAVPVIRDRLADGSDGPAMVPIPAGSFVAGTSRKREIRVNAFAIGRFETSFEEYDMFARASGRRLPGDEGWGRGNRPIINVSWEDAQQYTEWLSAQTGKRYRLPTEAEWIYAARGGTRSRFWWGESVGVNHANCAGCGSRWDNEMTAAVGSFAANPFGLHDVLGNVWEWVDACVSDNVGAAVAAAPRGYCGRRVARGGSWRFAPPSIDAGERLDFPARATFSSGGFRIARDM